jgi:hypothetical protein
MRFLTDEWLIDVKTDYAGKCVLLALALTVIEHPVFGERPAFFVTSGKRGGGKTTAVNMIALAILGKRAPAMAWSRVEEERRKAIFAAFLQGVPLIVFDNIARGSTLSCPVVEKALTAAELEDRVLGESRNERVSCTSAVCLTGNNILPKGDLASRTLMARIMVDRPDPENRAFAHPDPFQWTLDHRGQILEALFTILAGNPRLYRKGKDEKGRFKLWQRVVGSAIEHAAELAGMGMDFAKAFAEAEAEDEETASLTEALECLDKRAKGASFKSAEVLQWASAEDADGKTLRAFLEGASGALTARGVGRKLKAATDAPTIIGDGSVWTLRATRAHGNLTQFVVINATSRRMNPTLSEAIVVRAYARDQMSAASEYGGEFRNDIAGFLDLAVIEAAVDRGVVVRPPREGVSYRSGCDMSGGAHDSAVLAISHDEGETAVLDCLIEIKAPFNPTSAVEEIAATLKEYGLSSTVGDKYASGWMPDAFSKADITYAYAEIDRSEAYLRVLPKFMSGKVRLIDCPRLISQFASLERRTTPVGRDRVDHGPGGKDDCSNATALALTVKASSYWDGDLAWVGEVPKIDDNLGPLINPPGPSFGQLFGGMPWLFR